MSDHSRAVALAQELTKCWALLPTDDHKYPWRDMDEADQDARELVAALLGLERRVEELEECFESSTRSYEKSIRELNEKKAGRAILAAQIREIDTCNECAKLGVGPCPHVSSPAENPKP